MDHWSVSTSLLSGSCGHRAKHDQCLLLCSCRRGWAKVITRPWPSERHFPLSQPPTNPTNIQTETHWQLHIGREYSTFANMHPCAQQIRAVSHLLEMWQLRQALDMQASALWLISAAQLCRAIAAWLALQKAFSFLFLSLFSASFSLPSCSLWFSPVAFGFTTLNCYFGRTLLG